MHIFARVQPEEQNGVYIVRQMVHVQLLSGHLLTYMLTVLVHFVPDTLDGDTRPTVTRHECSASRAGRMKLHGHDFADMLSLIPARIKVQCAEYALCIRIPGTSAPNYFRHVLAFLQV